MCAALFGLIAVCSTMVFSAGAGNGRDLAAKARQKKRAPVEKEIEVAVRRGVDARDARDRLHGGRELLRDGARRLLERSRELEGDRHGQVAERAVGRHLDRKRRDVGDALLARHRVGDGVVKVSLKIQNHVRVASPSVDKLSVSS